MELPWKAVHLSVVIVERKLNDNGDMEGLSIINGVLDYSLQNEGSRSEGKMAVLKCSDNKEYILYRESVFPIDDEYFASFHGMNVKVEGKPEEDTGYFCVSSICPESGNEINNNKE